MEPIYRVSFFKRLIDSTGQQFDACQGAVEVHADNETRAVELARSHFAKLKQVNSWTLRADYEKPELLRRRKRVSAAIWKKTSSTN